ncbi:MAG: hypothetical protein GX465_00740 [Acidobacteria bacterium]|nr:hypothetical protein [Acidobacteriota bacterium]
MKPKDHFLHGSPRAKSLSESSLDSGPFPLKSRDVQVFFERFEKDSKNSETRSDGKAQEEPVRKDCK